LSKILDPTDTFRDINTYGFFQSKEFVYDIILNYTNLLNRDIDLKEVNYIISFTSNKLR